MECCGAGVRGVREQDVERDLTPKGEFGLACKSLDADGFTTIDGT